MLRNVRLVQFCVWKQDSSSNWQDYYCGLLMHILKTGVERFLCGKKAGPHILSRSRIRSLCLLVRFADLAKTVFSVRNKSHRCCNGSRARLGCVRSWVLAPVGSNQRIHHWYLLHIRIFQHQFLIYASINHNNNLASLTTNLAFTHKTGLTEHFS
jgi:hypothetical protein